MQHNLTDLRKHYGDQVVETLIRLRPLVRAATLKTGQFFDGPYPAFETRYNRLLDAVPPEEHEAVKRAMLAPVLSLNTFYEPTAQEFADYKRFHALVLGNFGEPPKGAPRVYLEDAFDIRGSMLRTTAKPLAGRFVSGPFPAHLRSAYGTGALRYTRPLVNGVSLALMFSKGLPGELALSCFAEKDGKGARLEPWTMFNFPQGWARLPSRERLEGRLRLVFESTNFFCDVVEEIDRAGSD